MEHFFFNLLMAGPETETFQQKIKKNAPLRLQFEGALIMCMPHMLSTQHVLTTYILVHMFGLIDV